SAADFVPQIHPSMKGPAHLNLPDRAALEPNEHDAVVLGFDGVHERVCPAHDLERTVILPHEIPDDLDAVAAQIDEGATACVVAVPEPRGMGAWMCLTRAHPEYVSDGTVSHAPHGLQCFRCVHEVLEIAGEDAGLLHRVQHALRFIGGASKGLRAEDGFPGLRTHHHGLFVQVVGAPDHDHIRLRVIDRILHAGCPTRDVPFLCKSASLLL